MTDRIAVAGTGVSRLRPGQLALVEAWAPRRRGRSWASRGWPHHGGERRLADADPRICQSSADHQGDASILVPDAACRLVRITATVKPGPDRRSR